MNNIVCGYYELTEDKVFTFAGYECAAWSTDTLVRAGRYPIHAEIESGHVKHFRVALPGTVTEDFFPALWCGNLIGKGYDTKKNAGKPSTHHLQIYGYNGPNAASWHIDYSLLPNVGACAECGIPVFGYDNRPSTQCPSCGVAQDRREEEAAARRYPRLIARLKHDSEIYHGSGARYVATALSSRHGGWQAPYYRQNIADGLRRISAAKRQFAGQLAGDWRVSKEGRVYNNGHFLGWLEKERAA